MLEHEVQEVLAGQCARAALAGAAIGVAERDVPVAVIKDAGLADDAAVEVAGEILQRRRAAPHALAVHDPLVGQPGRRGQTGLVEGLEHARAEHAGERDAVEQIPPLRLAPLAAPSIPGAAGGDDVAVGMEVQVAGMGVELRGQSGLAAEPGGVAGEVAQRRGGDADQRIEDRALVAPCDSAQPGG